MTCIPTRTELPSCEAIDVRNVNFGDIVCPDKYASFKVGTNFKPGTNATVFTDLKSDYQPQGWYRPLSMC